MASATDALLPACTKDKPDPWFTGNSRTTMLPLVTCAEHRFERLSLTGKEDDWTDRYLLCEHFVDPSTARPQRFEAVARFIRDLVAPRWVKTPQAREKANPKRIYYLAMEFLIGRTLNNDMMNLAAEPLVQSGRAVARHGVGRIGLLGEHGCLLRCQQHVLQRLPAG
jgi:hypothetical protein